MIGLEANKFKALLTSRLQDYGVLLDEKQPEDGITFIGMGNKRKATVDVPDDLTDENMEEKVNGACVYVFHVLAQGGE